ncbi:uncharacterized protein LOC108225153 [Daucus carota subsp. sativus]|uniref:uncharacterized protein LOC108225153 n=1 Tax=Daucus carota subsp. sativus TaxID=79200 RepID=UPI0007EFCED6|nr:PREDICTED: uncharacterized protein LOC108225153 [Daucus carota subsp. sativus]
MKILGFTCVLLLACYVIDFYKRVFDSFLGVLLMDCVSCLRFLRNDFEFGFLVLRCFRQLVWGFVLYVCLGLGFKVLEVGWQCWGFTQIFCVLGGVWSELRTGFASKTDFDAKNNVKFRSCELEDRFLSEKVDEKKECVDESDGEHGGTLKRDSEFSSCKCGFLEDRFVIEKLGGDKECIAESDDELGCTSKIDADVKSNLKFSSCKCGFLDNQSMIKKTDDDKECMDESDDELECFWSMTEKADDDEECMDESDDELECYDVDKECDVVKLRKLVKIERDRVNAAYVELEEERMAAATAAGETMAMILRLQNEKSVIEMEAHQFRRLAEEKQLHDQEVIESLRWIAMSCQSAVTQLEDQVRSLTQKVGMHLKDDEAEQLEVIDKSFSFNKYNFEDDALEDRLVSSLDLTLSSCMGKSHLETPSHRRN